MSGKSGFPQRDADAAGLSKELQKYLDKIGRPLDAIDDLPATPTTTQIATAFNALLALLRADGKMVE